MNRRKFLTFVGTAGVVSALGTAKVAKAGVHTFPYYDNGYGVLHDVSRCIGCRRCEYGCHKVNNLPEPRTPFEDHTATFTKRRTTPAEWTVVNRYDLGGGNYVFRKIQCFHCNDPACASACFTKCYTKNPNGAVTYNGDQCVGCRYCMIACPFYIPTFEYDEPFDPLIKKCTFCAPRLQEGKIPGCVQECPMGALTFGRRKDLIKIARKRMEDHPDKYVDYIYGEHDAGGTAWMVIMPKPKDAPQIPTGNAHEAEHLMAKIGLETDLGSQPMGEFTYGALGTVPMIISLWPVIFGGAYGMTKRREAIAKANMLKHAEEERQKAVDCAVALIEKEQGKEAAEKARTAMNEALSAQQASGEDK